MLRKALPLIVLAVMTAAAAPAAKAPAAKAPVAKAPPAKAPAAKAPASKAAPALPFAAGDPASLVAVLNAAGAKAQLGPRAQDTAPVTVTSPAANFTVLFVGCNAQGKACQAAVYDSPMAGASTLVQINHFNQSSAMCRGYLDPAGKPHVLYSVHTFAALSREHVMGQLAGWQGCLGDFAAFLKDPVGYLAEAP